MQRDAEAIIGRMKEAAGVSTDTALAKWFGLPRGTIASWKTRNSVPLQHCLQMAYNLGMSADWLLTGQGSHDYDDELRSEIEKARHALSVPDINPEAVEIVLAIIQRQRESHEIFKSIPLPRYTQTFLLEYHRILRMVEDACKKGDMDRSEVFRHVRRLTGLKDDPHPSWGPDNDAGPDAGET